MTRGARLALGVPLLALALLWIGVRRWVEVRPAPPLAPATRAAVLRALRATLDGGAWRPSGAGADLDRPAVGPVWVAAWRGGAPVLEHECRGATVGAALADCARRLAAAAAARGWSAAERAAVRLKVDVTTAEGPIASRPTAALAMSVVPGVDGIGVQAGAREVRLLPDYLLRADLLNGYSPLERFTEVRTGLHVPRVVNVLARRLDLDGAGWVRTRKRFFRFRTETVLEAATPDGAPLEIVRGTPMAEPRLDRDTLRAAALAGARYLVRQQRADGSFTYVYETLHDAALTADYSLPRHFGVASFLAEVHAATGDAAVGEALRRALAYAASQTHPGCSDAEAACIAAPDATTADLGATALALNAFMEHRRHGGDAGLDPLARRLATFLLRMQRPGGDFAHTYRLRERRADPTDKQLYYDGEATLALIKAHAVFHDPRYLEAGRRGLDWLTKTQYRHFAGRFYYGEDHWTCLAAGAAWPDLRDPAYERFCRGYAAFLRYQQFAPGEHPPELRGAYGFSPFLVPHNTPAGSRTEAMISAYELTRHHGRPDERIRRQVREALRYLLQHQLQRETCYLCADPARATGGFLESPVARHVRIDFVQHAGSALLRGAEIL